VGSRGAGRGFGGGADAGAGARLRGLLRAQSSVPAAGFPTPRSDTPLLHPSPPKTPHHVVLLREVLPQQRRRALQHGPRVVQHVLPIIGHRQLEQAEPQLEGLGRDGLLRGVRVRRWGARAGVGGGSCLY
jgi:hypothetical protein